MGLVPMLDYPDKLVQPEDYKEVIRHCHEHKIFAMYHQEASGVLKPGWSQGRSNLCWAYSLTVATMDARALEGQPPVRLSPWSLAWLVNWRNQGYYCDRAIAGARQRGIASVGFAPEYELNPRDFKDGWSQDALNYRPTEWWDTRWLSEESMVQQCLTILATGRPLYGGYNALSHAMEPCGLLWDETQRNNVIWIVRNSHDEPEPIEMVGRIGVPDEVYGPCATSLVLGV